MAQKDHWAVFGRRRPPRTKCHKSDPPPKKKTSQVTSEVTSEVAGGQYRDCSFQHRLSSTLEPNEASWRKETNDDETRTTIQCINYSKPGKLSFVFFTWEKAATTLIICQRQKRGKRRGNII